MNDFVKALFNNNKQDEITATFIDGAEATYTKNIYNLLVSDPAVVSITDSITGELLYIKA